MTLAVASRRTGVPLSALRKARRARAIRLTRDDLLLAGLTRNGEQTEGDVGDLAQLATWMDYVNHDGTTAAEVESDLARLAAEGTIVLAGGRFKLARPWP
jgi:hypothetical protein